METLRIAHISDTHLGRKFASLGRGREERERDIHETFLRIMKTVHELEPDIILLTGDIFDRAIVQNNAHITLRKGFEIVRGIPAYAIIGDHEHPRTVDSPPICVEGDLVKLLGLNTAESVEVKGAKIVGISNLRGRGAEQLPALLSKAEKILSMHKGPRILMIHQGIAEDLPPGASHEISLSQLPQSPHYIAAGHLHERKRRNHGKGIIAYPGSTEVLRKDEASHLKKGKGFSLVEISFDGDIKVNDIIIPVRPVINIDIDSSKKNDIIPALPDIIKSTINTLPQNAILKDKLPLIYIEMKGSIVSKQATYAELMETVKDITLDTVIRFLPTGLKRTKRTYESHMGVEEAVRAYIEKQNGVPSILRRNPEFGVELFDLLSSTTEKSKDRIAEGIKLARKFYERIYGSLDEEVWEV